MRIVVGVVGGVLVALMLFEIFLAFLLPRRVKRDPLLARRVAISAAPSGSVHQARFTFAISRHAIADLAYTVRAKPTGDEPDRLPQADFDAPLGELRAAGVEPGAEPEEIRAQLTRMRKLYEPYAEVLARTVELRLPPWLAAENPTDNWRTTAWH